MEEMRDAWFEAPDLKAQQDITGRMQQRALTEVPFVPLGLSFAPTAFRSEFTGFARSPYPVFWGVRKA